MSCAQPIYVSTSTKKGKRLRGGILADVTLALRKAVQPPPLITLNLVPFFTSLCVLLGMSSSAASRGFIFYCLLDCSFVSHLNLTLVLY